VKEISPTPMMVEAAAAIAPVNEQVTAIGAVAVQNALSGVANVIAPTSDVDLVLPGGTSVTHNLRQVIHALESADYRPSAEAGEAGFTWQAEDSKIQLVTGFAPFRKGALAAIPAQSGIEDFLVARTPVVFNDQPDVIQLYSANATALLGLKHRAFGRNDRRGRPIERDFADAHLLMQFATEEIARSFRQVPNVVRIECRRAIAEFAEPTDDGARRAALELERMGLADNVEEAMLAVRRSAIRLDRMIAA
jgi:hypothetical protein